MASFTTLRNLAKGRIPLNILKSFKSYHDLEYGMAACAVAEGYYKHTDFSNNMSERLKRIPNYLSEMIKEEDGYDIIYKSKVLFPGSEEDVISRHQADMYDIKIFDNSPFAPYPCFDFGDKDISQISRTIARLYSMNIGLKEGYVVNGWDWNITKIWNTTNDKLLYIVDKLPEVSYDKIELPPLFIDTSDIKDIVSLANGTFDGNINNIRKNDLDFESVSVLGFAIIRYPHILEMVNQIDLSNCSYTIQEARDFANLVYFNKIPSKACDISLERMVPPDALPIPPVDIVLQLHKKGGWDYFVTAWSILGGYNIPNLKYCYKHRELAFRNDVYNPNIKINLHTPINSDSLRWNKPLPSKNLFTKPDLRTIFELFYTENIDQDPPKNGSFYLWLQELGIKQEMIEELYEKECFLPDELACVVERPWSKVITTKQLEDYNKEELIKLLN